MVPKEHEVALVVECHDAAAPERGVLAEQAAKHAPDAQAESRAEVVQHELGFVRCRRRAPGYVAVENNRRHVEVRGGAVWEMAHEEAVDLALVLVDDHDVGEARCGRLSHDFLDSEARALVEDGAWEDILHGSAGAVLVHERNARWRLNTKHRA